MTPDRRLRDTREPLDEGGRRAVGHTDRWTALAHTPDRAVGSVGRELPAAGAMHANASHPATRESPEVLKVSPERTGAKTGVASEHPKRADWWRVHATVGRPVPRAPPDVCSLRDRRGCAARLSPLVAHPVPPRPKFLWDRCGTDCGDRQLSTGRNCPRYSLTWAFPVEVSGLEPPTSTLRTWRSTS